MIGILNIAGHQRKLLSLTTSYSKTICKKGYPDSLPIAHFFKVSFLTEEGDDFFADWMYGKNNHYQWQKGQWYNGTITFYDDTSYGQEFLHYELTTALATSFRVDYDQEKGMITTLEIFARERVYDHKFIINSEYYAIMFDYVEIERPKKKKEDTTPKIIDYYLTDKHQNIFKDNLKSHIGEKIWININSENLIGEKIILNLNQKEVDFEYQGKRLENDILRDFKMTKDFESIELTIIEPKANNHE